MVEKTGLTPGCAIPGKGFRSPKLGGFGVIRSPLTGNRQRSLQLEYSGAVPTGDGIASRDTWAVASPARR